MSRSTRYLGILGILCLVVGLLSSVATSQVPLLLTFDVPENNEISGRTSIEARNKHHTLVGNFTRGPSAFELLETHDGVKLRLIQCPGSPVVGTAVKAVNDRGEVAGWCRRGNETVGYLRKRTRQGQSTFQFIDVPGSTLTEVVGLNEDGQLVGDYRGADGQFHGFFWDAGTLITLTVPGASFTAPTALNNNGEIIGFAGDGAGGVDGWRYDGVTFTPLRVPGAALTIPVDINDQGQIVGTFAQGGQAGAFLYEEGVFRLIPPPRPEIVALDILGITQDTRIVGRYLTATGTPGNPFDSRGFLLVFLGGTQTLRELTEESVAAMRTSEQESGGVGLHLDGCPEAVAPPGSLIPAKIAGRAMFCKR